MHETHAPFLKNIFPKSLFLHGMYGATFRPPYPRTYLFDHQGLYGNSLLAQNDVISNLPLSEDDKTTLYKIKNWYAQQIIPHDPTWAIIEKYQIKFDKLILLPLQVNGYYAFDECSNYQNQYDFLLDVLEHVPNHWGIVVTGHSEYDKTISNNRFLTLKTQHNNLIWLDELDNIPYVSQALLPHIDAVICVSSSLAFQALLYDKPVISAGKSHINVLASCDLTQIANVFDLDYPLEKNFKLLKFFFLKYHLLQAVKLENAHNLYDYLNQYFMNFKNQQHNTNADILPNLYDNLNEYYQNLMTSSQWRQWNQLLSDKSIQKTPNPVFLDMVFHEIISWDLFDTLVDRPFIHPHELFQAVEDSAKHITHNVYLPFHMLRRESERLARHQFANHRHEIRHHEIYHCFEQISKLPKQHIKKLQQLELDAEFLAIKPRRLMQRTWQMAGVLGKVRSIITDIYLDEAFIKKVLIKNGYGDYDFLLVSAQERSRKEDGSIFPEYLELIHQNYPNKIGKLHIGDNPRADGEMARKFGISTRVIPKAMDQFRQSYFAKLLEKPLRQNSYDTSLVIGLIANRFFSSPHSYFDKNSISNRELYHLGYALVGPFLVGYVQWLIRQISHHQSDGVYFLARDGYLIMKVYELFKQQFAHLPEGKYLLCSRRSLAVAAMFDLDDIFETAMLNYGHTTVENFISSRFGLAMRDIPKAVLKKYRFKSDGSSKIRFPEDIPITNALVKDIQAIILNKAEQERSLYLQYLQEKGIFDHKRNALVDIGYSGTMQRKLKRITNQSFVGLYMLTHNYVLQTFSDEVFLGWLAEYDSQRSTIRHVFNNFIPLLESMLSSEKGSFVNFYQDEHGQRQANYLYSVDEERRCHFVRDIQKGTLDFAQDFIDRLGKFSLQIELSPQVSSELLFAFGKNPSALDVELFEGLLLENMFAGSEFDIIANPYPLLNNQGKLTNEQMNYLIQISKWKEGAVVAYQKYLEKPVIPTHSLSEKTIAQITEQHANVQKSLPRNERLLRKLQNNPRLFIEDVRFLPNPVKKIITKHDVLLKSSQMLIGQVLKKQND